MLTLIALVVVAVFGTVAVYRYKPTRVEGTYHWFDRWRKIIWGLVLVGVVWTFLRSGRPELIAAAIVSIVLVTVFVLVEKPHRTLV